LGYIPLLPFLYCGRGLERGYDPPLKRKEPARERLRMGEGGRRKEGRGEK